MNCAPKIEVCMLPCDQEPDFGHTSGRIWERNSIPGSDGNPKPEKQVGEDNTNVHCGVESDVNLGFGSKTVDTPSPPRVDNSTSDRVVLGFPGQIIEHEFKPEMEIPQSILMLAPSPPCTPFNETDKGGRPSASRDHVPDTSWTPSRYARSPSRLRVGTSSFPSHSILPEETVPVNTANTDKARAREPDRPGAGGLRKVPDEEQRVEPWCSPANIHPCIGEDEQQGHRPEVPAAMEMDISDPTSLLPRSVPSDPGMRGCSPTAPSSSARTEVSSTPQLSAAHVDSYAAPALRWKLHSGGLNEMVTGKMKTRVGSCENDSGGAEIVDGYRAKRGSSEVTVDGLDGGGEELCSAGLDGVSGRVFIRANAPEDLDSHDSRCSSSCSTSGSYADGDRDSGSLGLLAGSYSPLRPHSPSPGLSSDHWFALGSRSTMGGTVSQTSRYQLQFPHQTLAPGSPKAATSSISSRSIQTVPRTNNAGALLDSARPNTNRIATWMVQTQDHVLSDTQEFDTLRFSSSSPSTSISASALPSISAARNVHLGKNRLDEDKASHFGGSGSAINGPVTLELELRRDMKIDMKPDFDTRTGLNSGADGAVFSCHSLNHPLTAKFINDWGDGDNLGELEREDVGQSAFGSRGRASRISRSESVAGVPGVSAAGPLFNQALGTRFYLDDEDTDTRSPPSLDSTKLIIQSRSTDNCVGGEEEVEECGLLKSLLSSSDPWGLMRKRVLHLPSPTPEEIERKRKRTEEDVVRVRKSLGRRGVGYVTPPSKDAVLGLVDLSGEVEMEVKGHWRSDDEDSQEILDFRSSQPRTGHSSLFRPDVRSRR